MDQEVRKGLWSPDEDEKLRRCIAMYQRGSWSDIAKKAGLQRCGKSCRRRWMNHLRPGLKRGRFTPLEIKLVVELHRTLGNRWSEIAGHLVGRTDNDVKNLWNTQIKRCLNKLPLQQSQYYTIKPCLSMNQEDDKSKAMLHLKSSDGTSDIFVNNATNDLSSAGSTSSSNESTGPVYGKGTTNYATFPLGTHYIRMPLFPPIKTPSLMHKYTDCDTFKLNSTTCGQPLSDLNFSKSISSKRYERKEALDEILSSSENHSDIMKEIQVVDYSSMTATLLPIHNTDSNVMPIASLEMATNVPWSSPTNVPPNRYGTCSIGTPNSYNGSTSIINKPCEQVNCPQTPSLLEYCGASICTEISPSTLVNKEYFLEEWLLPFLNDDLIASDYNGPTFMPQV